LEVAPGRLRILPRIPQAARSRQSKGHIVASLARFVEIAGGFRVADGLALGQGPIGGRVVEVGYDFCDQSLPSGAAACLVVKDAQAVLAG